MPRRLERFLGRVVEPGLQMAERNRSARGLDLDIAHQILRAQDLRPRLAFELIRPADELAEILPGVGEARRLFRSARDPERGVGERAEQAKLAVELRRRRIKPQGGGAGLADDW